MIIDMEEENGERIFRYLVMFIDIRGDIKINCIS